MAEAIQPPPPPPPPLPLVAYCYDGSNKQMFRLLKAKANNGAVVYDKSVLLDLYASGPWDLIEEDLEYSLPDTYEWVIECPRTLANQRDINRRVGGEEAVLYWKRNNSEKTVADWETEEVLGTVTHFKLMFIGKDFEHIRLNWYLTEYVAEGDRLRSICKVRIENEPLKELRRAVLTRQRALEDALLAKYSEEKRVGGVLPQNSPLVRAVVTARDGLRLARKAVTGAVRGIRMGNIMDFDRVIGLKREAEERGAIVDQQIAAGLANQNEEDNAAADGHLAWAAGDANLFYEVPLVD